MLWPFSRVSDSGTVGSCGTKSGTLPLATAVRYSMVFITHLLICNTPERRRIDYSAPSQSSFSSRTLPQARATTSSSVTIGTGAPPSRNTMLNSQVSYGVAGGARPGHGTSFGHTAAGMISTRSQYRARFAQKFYVPRLRFADYHLPTPRIGTHSQTRQCGRPRPQSRQRFEGRRQPVSVLQGGFGDDALIARVRVEGI